MCLTGNTLLKKVFSFFQITLLAFLLHYRQDSRGEMDGYWFGKYCADPFYPVSCQPVTTYTPIIFNEVESIRGTRCRKMGSFKNM